MFTSLAAVALMASETPAEKKLWNTKVASDSADARCFIDGFTSYFIKEAEDRDNLYETSSVLGKELGATLLDSIKNVK